MACARRRVSQYGPYARRLTSIAALSRRMCPPPEADFFHCAKACTSIAGTSSMSAVAAGATAVIQPGGSMRDDEVIKAADDNDIAMVMTGMRHFRH